MIKDIFNAIKKRKLQIINEIIKDKQQIHKRNKEYQTPLMIASYKNYPETVKIFLNYGSEINAVDLWKQSALMLSYGKNKEIVQMLINNGADVNARNAYNRTPLMYFSEYGTVSCIKFLIDNGAQINAVDDDLMSALMNAAMGKNTEAVKLLLEKGADVNLINIYDETALDIAYKYYAIDEMIKILKKYKALRSREINKKINKKKIVNNKIMIRSSSCPGCGSPKINLSSTPYIYCDYCAQLIDWDYKIAYKLSSHISISKLKAYQKINKTLEDSIGKTIRKRNIEKYKELLIKQTENNIKFYPDIYSPRMKDKIYKKKYLDFIVKSYVIYTFDRSLKNLKKEQDDWNRKILWFEKDGITIAESISFRKLYETFCRYTQLCNSILKTKGIFESYPEKISENIWYRISMSEFVQIWLPYLTDNDKIFLLNKSGFSGDYHEYKNITGKIRHCGCCGSELKVPEKSVKFLCEYCGYILDVSVPEINCPSCGSSMTLPKDRVQIQCTKCKTVIIK